MRQRERPVLQVIESIGIAAPSRPAPRPPHALAAEAWLPQAAPLPMPRQSLREGGLSPARPATSPATIGWRRAAVIGTTALLTAVATFGMTQVLRVEGLSLLDMCLLGLFVALFAWIALSAVTAFAGFCVLLTRRRNPLGLSAGGPLPRLQPRTALLMPTCREDPARVLAGLQAGYESVAATGQLESFDFFVLSDSRRPEVV